MCKESLRADQKRFVEQASGMARELVQREARGPGDTDNAMRRLARRHGVPYGFLWSLRYRPPKDILMGAWFRLTAAYEAECERVERRAREAKERAGALQDAANPGLGQPDLLDHRRAMESAEGGP